MLKNKSILMVILFVSSFASAQKVVHVKGQHSKILIYSLKKDEYLGTGEAKILVKSNGLDYEFITQTNDPGYHFTYHLYHNSKLVGDYSSPRFLADDYWYTETKKGDKTLSTLHFKSGKSYGPCKTVYPIYDYNNYEIKGVKYMVGDEHYAELFSGGKKIGPYSSLTFDRCTIDELAYIYGVGDQQYLNSNGKVFGPYLEIQNKSKGKSIDDLYFSYKNEQNNWKMNVKGTDLPDEFTESPYLYILGDGSWVIEGRKVNGNGEKEFISQSAKGYCDDSYCRTYVNTSGNQLTVKATEGNYVYSDRADVSLGGQSLGLFGTEYIYSDQMKNSSYFSLVLYTHPDDDGSNLTYYLVNDKGLSAPIKDVDRRQIYLIGDDFYYIRKSDSTLMMNGKETEHKKVIRFDYSGFPENQIIVKKVGMYDVFYNKGKKMTVAEIRQAKYSPDWYNMVENKFAFEQKGDKMYVIPKGSGKRFGPVNKRSSFEFSKDNLHYAECDERKMEVYIDGKLTSNGFCLTYDRETNAFYWISVDNTNGKVYLHTYLN